jgi:hypothetical protein
MSRFSAWPAQKVIPARNDNLSHPDPLIPELEVDLGCELNVNLDLLLDERREAYEGGPQIVRAG